MIRPPRRPPLFPSPPLFRSSRAPRGGERLRGFHHRVALRQVGGRGTRLERTAERADSRRAQGAHEAVFPLQRRGAGGGFGGGGGGGGGGRGGVGGARAVWCGWGGGRGRRGGGGGDR